MGDVYLEMTDRLMLSGSKLIPELFRMVVDSDEAALMLAMPGTPEQLAAARSAWGADCATGRVRKMPSPSRKCGRSILSPSEFSFVRKKIHNPKTHRAKGDRTTHGF